jgi:hypothetical protein
MELIFDKKPSSLISYIMTLDSVSYMQETGTGGSIQLVQISNKLKGGYRFGYGNHEKIDEIAGAGNTIDMGDRWLDTRIGRTPKTDFHEKKYPFISPYSYSANSPIAYHDPDGKDYRLSIIKNKQGETKIVSAHATVYLQGVGASQEMANKLNKEFQDKYAGFRKVKGVDVAFDVVYVYDGDNTKNEKNLKNGQNIFNVRTDLEKDYRSEVYGVQDLKGNKFYTGKTGTINSKSYNLTRTVVHETLHFMGLSDRYDNFKNNLYTGSETHEGFYKDIMGGGDKISDVHYKNLLNYANTKDKDYTIQNNEMYDRASQSELKNGNKPNTQYHERSTQVQGE